MKDAIPETDSIQELARFWDQHDVTDYLDELEEVEAPVFQRADVIPVPLTSSEHEAIRKLATTQGVDESSLLHEWVREKLRSRGAA